MEVFVDYSDKSFAVYGDTKPYKDELRQLGGKFNSNLKGGPGWIFPNKLIDDVAEFVAVANNALRQASPKINTNIVKTYSKPVTKPRSLIPKITPIANLSLVDNKNNFVAEDGVRYQIIVNTCPLPFIGQGVTFVGNNEKIDYTVLDMMTDKNDILLTNDEEEKNETSVRAVIINGKWQIFAMIENHELIFH